MLLREAISPMIFRPSPVALCGGDGYLNYISIKAAELNNDDETIENYFLPLYNKILFYWFPPCPQWVISEPEITNYTLTFVIEHDRHPLLLNDIKPPSDFKFQSGRNIALNEVLQCLEEMGPKNHHADRLYAISAIGERWRANYA